MKVVLRGREEEKGFTVFVINDYACGLGFRGSGFRVQGSGFRV